MNFWEKLLGKDRPLRIKRRKKETVDSDPKPAPKVAEDQQSSRPPVGPTPRQTELSRLHQLVDYGFDANELRDLCLDLGIDYDSLPDKARAAKTRELMLYLKRYGRMDEFVALCSRLRPNAPWDIPAAPRYEPYGRETLAHLHRALEENFDEGQVRDLCASLEVDYQRLPYVDQGGAARELVLHLARRERLAELVQVCSQRRPDVPWANILDRKDEQPTVDNAQPVSRVELRQMLVRFDKNHLRDICLELGVDYDDLHAGKQAKIRELIAYCERRGRTAELAAACSRRRSDVA